VNDSGAFQPPPSLAAAAGSRIARAELYSTEINNKMSKRIQVSFIFQNAFIQFFFFKKKMKTLLLSLSLREIEEKISLQVRTVELD
jgi:hypothetical protein